MIENFPTREAIRKEIRKQFKGFQVEIKGLHSGYGPRGGPASHDAGFSGYVYDGPFWTAILTVLEPNGRLLFTDTVYFCTPAQYHTACQAKRLQRQIDSYPLDTLTYILSHRCEALPNGLRATIFELPRTIANYVFGWGRQDKFKTASVSVRYLSRHRRRRVVQILNKLKGLPSDFDKGLEVGDTVRLRNSLYRKGAYFPGRYQYSSLYARKGLEGKVIDTFVQKTYSCVKVQGTNGKIYDFRESSLDKI